MQLLENSINSQVIEERSWESQSETLSLGESRRRASRGFSLPPPSLLPSCETFSEPITTLRSFLGTLKVVIDELTSFLN